MPTNIHIERNMSIGNKVLIVRHLPPLATLFYSIINQCLELCRNFIVVGIISWQRLFLLINSQTMNKILFISILMFCATVVYAQDDLQTGSRGEGYEYIDMKSYRHLSVGVGAGLSFGNLGVQLQWRATQKFGLSAGIGTRAVPLTFPIVVTVLDNDDYKPGVPFINKTLHGISYHAGFNFYAATNVYMKVSYAKFGEWTSIYDNEKKTLQGFILGINGSIPLGYSPFLITVGGAVGYAFGKDPALKYFDNTNTIKSDVVAAFLLSVNVGVVYRFYY